MLQRVLSDVVVVDVTVDIVHEVDVVDVAVNTLVDIVNISKDVVAAVTALALTTYSQCRFLVFLSL